MAKNLKNSQFWPIFGNYKSIKKNKSKKSKFWLRNFLGNIVVSIQAKYQKDRIKTEGAYGKNIQNSQFFVIKNP